MQEINVEEDSIVLDIDVPGNEEIDTDDIVTSRGINILPNETVIFTKLYSSRIMDMSFDVIGAERVTIDFTRRTVQEDVLLEVI